MNRLEGEARKKGRSPHLSPIILNRPICFDGELRFKDQSFAGAQENRTRRPLGRVLVVESNGCDFVVSEFLNFLRSALRFVKIHQLGRELGGFRSETNQQMGASRIEEDVLDSQAGNVLVHGNLWKEGGELQSLGKRFFTDKPSNLLTSRRSIRKRTLFAISSTWLSLQMAMWVMLCGNSISMGFFLKIPVSSLVGQRNKGIKKYQKKSLLLLTF